MLKAGNSAQKIVMGMYDYSITETRCWKLHFLLLKMFPPWTEIESRDIFLLPFFFFLFFPFCGKGSKENKNRSFSWLVGCTAWRCCQLTEGYTGRRFPTWQLRADFPVRSRPRETGILAFLLHLLPCVTLRAWAARSTTSQGHGISPFSSVGVRAWREGSWGPGAWQFRGPFLTIWKQGSERSF